MRPFNCQCVVHPNTGLLMSLTPSRQWFVAALGLFALIFLIYTPSLGHEFINWDDPMFVYENARIRSLDFDHVRTMFTTTEAGAYTPLSQLSLAIDYAIWKSNPFGYHLTAVLLHCLNACLVLLVARLLTIKSPIPRTSATTLAGSLAAAMVFALHPMRVESVAWASERRDVLCGFFALLAAVMYLKFATGDSGARRGAWYISAWICFVCAVISKTVAVMLPLVFLLVDIYLRRNIRSNRSVSRPYVSLFLEKIPFFLVSAIAGIGTVGFLVEGGHAIGTREIGWEPRLAQSLAADLEYLRRWIWPIPLNPLDILRRAYDFRSDTVRLSILVHMAVTGGLLTLGKRWRGAWIAWFSYLVLIAPLLGLAQSGLQFTADRYTYLATIPLGIGISFGVVRAKPSWTVLGIFGLVLLGWSVLTWKQIDVWENSETFWTHVLRLDGNNAVAWSNLGVAYADRGEFAKAIISYEQAVKANPKYIDAWYNMGNACGKSRRTAEAMKDYERTLALDPLHVGAHHNLANLLLDEGAMDAALRHYLLAYELQPGAPLEESIATAYEAQKRMNLALEWYRRSAEHGWPAAFISWSELVRKQGDQAKALKLLKEGMDSTKDPSIQLAFAEAILNDPSPSKEDWLQTGIYLQEMDHKLDGKSKRVRQLLRLFQHRQHAPAVYP